MSERQHELPDIVLARRLHETGFISSIFSRSLVLETSPVELERHLRSYQEFHGIANEDGWCGPLTRTSLQSPRWCAHPDVMPRQAAESLCRWRLKRLAWCITGQLPGITALGLQQAYAFAWRAWADVCDLEAVQVSTTDANVLMGSGPIDGGNRTLAWSEMPCGDGLQQLRQLYDTAEVWGNILVRVAIHEIGHALGIPHLGAGSIMYPIIGQYLKPMPLDIAEAVRRYGPKVVDPPPPPDAGEEYVITFRTPVTKVVVRRLA